MLHLGIGRGRADLREMVPLPNVKEVRNTNRLHLSVEARATFIAPLPDEDARYPRLNITGDPSPELTRGGRPRSGQVPETVRVREAVAAERREEIRERSDVRTRSIV